MKVTPMKTSILLALAASALAQSPVTTAQYGNDRLGANPAETILTPETVNASKFGKLFTMPADGQELFYQRLHALDIATGNERPGSPVLIRASVTGSAWFGLITREIRFHSLLENPRAALLLSRGVVYIAWGSSCDVSPYHGWV